jgi:hypothetical protein
VAIASALKASERSMYLLGTDEAGYGPNLGPLVIGASLWKVATTEPTEEVDLYARLSSGVTDTRKDVQHRLAIADSKQLYSSGDSLDLLERGVLAALAALDRPIAHRTHLFQALGSEWNAQLPWQAQGELKLPRDTSHIHMQTSIDLWQQSCAAGNVELLDFRSVVLEPGEFNRRCEQLGNKAAVLSAATLGLVRETIAPYRDAPMKIICDKHGGRNSYAGLVMGEITQHEVTNNAMLQTLGEGRSASAYRWLSHGQPREIWFLAKGERFLPAALASMAAKYLRELSMEAWNHFWQQHLPELAPTAGYPEDAKRFRQAIEPLTRQWDWEESIWWRMK